MQLKLVGDSLAKTHSESKFLVCVRFEENCGTHWTFFVWLFQFWER